jgi:hypothetical protein
MTDGEGASSQALLHAYPLPCGARVAAEWQRCYAYAGIAVSVVSSRAHCDEVSSTGRCLWLDGCLIV